MNLFYSSFFLLFFSLNGNKFQILPLVVLVEIQPKQLTEKDEKLLRRSFLRTVSLYSP